MVLYHTFRWLARPEIMEDTPAERSSGARWAETRVSRSWAGSNNFMDYMDDAVSSLM
jgi:hypothetical protein